jgi:predicted nucleic acid-binding protein
MAEYTVDPGICWVSPESRIVDTNILVGYFEPTDKWHEKSRTYLDYLAERGTVPLIPLTVVVEAWGKLDPGADIIMLEWVSQPGNIEILPENYALVPHAHTISRKFKTDFIDSLLALYAVNVTKHAALRQPVPIATFDQRNWDLWKHMEGKLVYVNPENDEPYI